MEGLGAGLATLGFWLMVAAAIVAGMWFPARMARLMKETEIAKLRLAIESGQLSDQVLKRLWRGEMAPQRKLRVAGSIVLSAGAGIAVLGWFVGQAEPLAAMPIYGCGALTACVGLGLWLASAVVGGGERD